MKYCKICILPSTRPNIKFDDLGNCNCATKTKKNEINWAQREEQFKDLISLVKSKNAIYDCIIPVSGGKDSTWQTVKALEYGLNPLCVTWRTPARNSIGQENLNNLIGLGVNHIDFSINPKVEKRFTLKAFERMGSTVIPMHMALHAIPLQVAVNFKIPLILWGENSAFEYGSEDKELTGHYLDHAWLKKFGVTNGTCAEDWVDHDLSINELAPYRWPSDESQIEAGVKAIFMGHFFNWDPYMAYETASKNGFRASSQAKTGYYKFADIDDAFLITIHHWMKWYKFGFTRLWDNLSLDIRNEMISRDDAISLVKEFGPETPHKEIDQFCEYVDISSEHFYAAAEKFRDKNIWKKNKNGDWQIDNFLIKDWIWS